MKTETFNIKALFERLFKIYPDEFSLVQIFFITMVLIDIYFGSAFAVSQTIFLKSYTQEQLDKMLPLFYMSAAIGTLIISLFQMYVLSRVSLKKTIIAVHIIYAFSYIIFREVLDFKPSLLSYILVVWVEISGYFIAALTYNYMSNFFNLNQAGRVYGYINAGVAVGALISGILVSVLVQYLSIENILLVISLTLVLLAFITFITSRFGAEKYQYIQSEGASNKIKKSALSEIFTDKYIVSLFVIVFAAYVITVFTEYNMLTVANHSLNSEQLAIFFSKFFILLGIIQLVIQFLLLPILYKYFGVSRSLQVFPIYLLVAVLFSIIYPGLASITAVNIGRGAMLETLVLTCIEILLLPILPHLRNYTQSIANIILPTGGQFLGGLIILFLAYNQNTYQVYYSIALIFFILITMVAIFYLVKEYKCTLISSFSRLVLNRLNLGKLLCGLGSKTIIKKILETHIENPSQVLIILSSLDKKMIKDLGDVVVNFVNSENEFLAAHAISVLPTDQANEYTFKKFLNDKRPKVQEQAIMAYMKVKKNDGIAIIKLFLDSDTGMIAAMSSIFQYGGKTGREIVRHKINELLSSDPIKAIQVIGSVQDELFVDQINNFLIDSNDELREAAINACIKLKNIAFMSNLFSNLKQRKHLYSTINALKTIHSKDLLQHIKVIYPESTKAMQLALLKVLAKVNDYTAVAILVEIIANEQDENVLVSGIYALRGNPFSNEFQENELLKIKLLQENIVNKLFSLRSAYQGSGSSVDLQYFLANTIYLYTGLLFMLVGIQVNVKFLSNLAIVDLYLVEDCWENSIELLSAWTKRSDYLKILPTLSPPLSKIRFNNDPISKESYEALFNVDSWWRSLAVYYKKDLYQDWLFQYVMTDNERYLHSLIDTVIFMKQSRLFGILPVNNLISIAEEAKEIKIVQGERLFSIGDPPKALYIIKQGAISTMIGNMKISLLKSGDSIGELALLDGMPRAMSAVASEDATLLTISLDDFNNLLLNNSVIIQGLLRILAGAIRTNLKLVNSIETI